MRVEQRLVAALKVARDDDPMWPYATRLALHAPHPTAPSPGDPAAILPEVIRRLPDREKWPEASATGRAFDRLQLAPPHQRLDPGTAAILRDDLADRTEALTLARSLIGATPSRRFIDPSISYRNVPSPSVEARSVARLLQADAAIRLHDGDADGAIASCRALLGLARSIGDEPLLTSQLDRLLIAREAAESVQRSLALGTPSSEPALAALQAELLAEAARPAGLLILRIERAGLDDSLTHRTPVEAHIARTQSHPDPRARPLVLIGRLWFLHQRVVQLEGLNELVALAGRPTAEWHRGLDAWSAQFLNRSPLSLVPRPVAFLGSPMLASAPSALRLALQTRSQLELTAILVAAERGRLLTGRWPEAFDPAWLPPSQAVDPHAATSGQTYRLHRDAEQGTWIVSSVGPDGVDGHEPDGSMTLGSDDIEARGFDPVSRAPQPPDLP
jgi:hypothetical protein